jgi:hypothetical protein
MTVSNPGKGRSDRTPPRARAPGADLLDEIRGRLAELIDAVLGPAPQPVPVPVRRGRAPR